VNWILILVELTLRQVTRWRVLTIFSFLKRHKIMMVSYFDLLLSLKFV